MGFIFLVSNAIDPAVIGGVIVTVISTLLVLITDTSKKLPFFVNPWFYVYCLDLVFTHFNLLKDYYINEAAPWYETIFLIIVIYISAAIHDIFTARSLHLYLKYAID